MLRIELTCAQAEAQVEVAVARPEVVAEGGAKPPAEVEPTAAAANAPPARFSTNWVHYCFLLVFSVPVLAPLIYVAVFHSS